jgi:hypothetical protein
MDVVSPCIVWTVSDRLIVCNTTSVYGQLSDSQQEYLNIDVERSGNLTVEYGLELTVNGVPAGQYCGNAPDVGSRSSSMSTSSGGIIPEPPHSVEAQ